MPPDPDELDELLRLRARIETLEAGREIDPVVQAIANSSPDNIMLLDVEGRIQYINWTVPDLDRERVRDTPVYEFVPEEYREAMRRCFARVLATGEPDRYRSAFVDEVGEISYWESRVRGVLRDGRVVGFTVNSSNLTDERREAAERERFFELSLDMLCVCDQTHFRRINPAFERTLGYTTAELLDQPFLAFVHPEDRERTALLAERIQSGETIVDFENRYRRKDGAYRHISWRVAADRGRRFHAVGRDVTGHREIELQTRHAQKLEAVGLLAGGVAHDFNNLLLVIRANVECSVAARADDARREYLGEVMRACDHAAELTKRLLAFSRRQAVRAETIDVNVLGRDLTKLLRRLLPENIELVLSPGDHLPAVSADVGQIEQVIVNLCLNARDAMPSGGRLTFATRHVVVGPREGSVDHPMGHVVFRVTDTGIGIPAHLRERIFEPFFTTKELGRGTGLGLATAYGIVQQHGGFVRFDSDVGRGTTFEVYLPAYVGVPTPARVGVDPSSPRGTETILVAEDDAMVRKVVVRTLEEAGYHVVAASDGAEAVRTFAATPDRFDVLLFDVVMPSMSGPEACRAIAEIRPGVPVIFTSGYSDPSRLPADVPPHRVLSKPYPTAELLTRVRAVLDDEEIR